VNPLDALAIALLVVAVILGARSGALPQLGGLVGAAIGALGGLWAMPLVLPYLDPLAAALRVGAVLGILLLAVGLGEMIGAHVGRAASHVLGDGLLGSLDRVAGGIVGAGQAVLIVWLMGGIFATGFVPSFARAAQTSVAVRGIDLFLPPPTELVLALGKALDATGLPDVFLGLERLPARQVDLPASPVAEALGARALPSVPRVEADACNYTSTGTGIVVKAGYVVTNAHVIAGASRIRVVTAAGALRATLVYIDPKLDVALLRVSGLEAGPLFFATADPPAGAIGATVGYPNGGPAVIGPAAVDDTYQAEGLDIYGTARVQREILELHAVVDPGDSGGPLLLTDGTVGGLVFAESRSDPAIGYALSPVAIASAIAPALGRTVAVPTGSCLH
jgi:S1-C subfamily serine protease